MAFNWPIKSPEQPYFENFLNQFSSLFENIEEGFFKFNLGERRNTKTYKRDFKDLENILFNLSDLDNLPYWPSHFSDLTNAQQEQAVADGYKRFWRDFKILSAL